MPVPLIPRKPLTPSRVLFWVGAAALTVRFLYLAEHAASPFFHVAILDEKFYDSLARALAEGREAAGLNPGFRPWAYPLLLSALYRLGGDAGGYLLAQAVQHLMGAATAVLAADLAMRLFRRPVAGALAGGLYVLAGPPLFFEGELLITSLFTFQAAVLLSILSRAAVERPRAAAWWLAAGVWTGLAAQARPNVLLFLLAFPAAALLLHGGPPRRRWTLAGTALAGALATLAAFGLVHQGLAGRFQLVAGAGGVNFYLGNKAGADGMVPRQDRRVTYGEEYRDSVQVFAEELYREELGEGASGDGDGVPAPDEVSRYWLGRAVEDIAADPWRWLGLMGRKTLFLAWNHEIPNNKSYDFVRRHESRLLEALPVRWWLLLALGVPGALAAFAQGDRRVLFWIVAFLTLHAAGLVLFFVTSRYRIPMWPGMAVLAAGGLLAFAEAVRRRSWPDLAVAGLTAAGVAAVSLVNWLQVEPGGFARDHFYRSLAFMEKGRLEEAHADALASVGLDPTEPAARFQLGNTALALGDDDLAYRHYRVAQSLSPAEPRIANNLGVVIEGRGRPDVAYGYYLRALALAPDYAPALVNAALLELRAGLMDPAAAKIERAEALGLESVLLDCARAFLERDLGRGDAAAAILERARRDDPETVERLLEENRRRLAPGLLDREPSGRGPPADDPTSPGAPGR